uniref:Uncharacterized protein n=1 Tax=Ananas comosus var. bracteatus TaxID=296719 RepID=A0A6V7QR95_ANACO
MRPVNSYYIYMRSPLAVSDKGGGLLFFLAQQRGHGRHHPLHLRSPPPPQPTLLLLLLHQGPAQFEAQCPLPSPAEPNGPSGRRPPPPAPSPIHRAFHRLTLRHGPLIHVRLGSTLCVVAAGADVARDLLKTHDAAFSDRPQTIAARRFAYDSAAFAFAPYSPYYRFMRRLCMSELLGARTVDQLRPIRRAEFTALLHTLLEKSKLRERVNLSRELIRLTNNMVMRMAASTTSSAAGGEAEEARELAKQVAELIGAFNVEDHIAFCRGWDPQGLSKRIRDVHARFDGLLERIIKEKEEARRRKKKHSNREGGEEDDDGVVKDVLDILLDAAEDEKAETKLSRENIKGFIVDIFTAGSDTTAASIEWVLAETLNHPHVLQKLRREIDQVVGNGRVVDETDLPNLPYLQAAVKEIMRLHPPAPSLPAWQQETSRSVATTYRPAPHSSSMYGLSVATRNTGRTRRSSDRRGLLMIGRRST